MTKYTARASNFIRTNIEADTRASFSVLTYQIVRHIIYARDFIKETLVSTKTYPYGQQVILQARFEVTSGGVTSPIDFDQVKLEIEKPNGTEVEFVYPGTLTRVEAGLYEYPYLPDSSGLWYYRFTGLNGGNSVAATEDLKFTVVATRMNP